MIFFQNWKNTKCKMIWTGPRIGGSSCWLLREFLLRDRKIDRKDRRHVCMFGAAESIFFEHHVHSMPGDGDGRALLPAARHMGENLWICGYGQEPGGKSLSILINFVPNMLMKTQPQIWLAGSPPRDLCVLDRFAAALLMIGSGGHMTGPGGVCAAKAMHHLPMPCRAHDGEFLSG